MVMPGRNWTAASADGYRFGFNGKESDSETYGKGNEYDYGFRIYNPRLGKFLSVDPLSRGYAALTPYQFAGNTPIWAIDIDGLEPGVVLGSTTQVQAINDYNQIYNNDPDSKNSNWSGFELTTIDQAINDIQNYKDAGNTMKAIYYQTHGSPGTLPTGEGKDGVLNVQQQVVSVDDIKTSALDIDSYLKDLSVINSIKNDKKRTAAFKENILGNPEYAAIYKFTFMTDLIEDGGTLILGGCHIAMGSEGENLLLALNTLTQNRISIIASQDLTIDVIPCPQGESSEFLDRTRTTEEFFNNGWSIINETTRGESPIVEDTGKDLQLNSQGELYDFVKTND